VPSPLAGAGLDRLDRLVDWIVGGRRRGDWRGQLVERVARGVVLRQRSPRERPRRRRCCNHGRFPLVGRRAVLTNSNEKHALTSLRDVVVGSIQPDGRHGVAVAGVREHVYQRAMCRAVKIL